MKRLLIRISALATVVALGLIAIAQAQRSTDDSPPDGLPTDDSKMAATDEGTVESVFAPASRDREPGLFPVESGINPIRNPLREYGYDDVIQTSGTSEQRYPTLAPAADSPVAGEYGEYAEDSLSNTQSIVTAVGTSTATGYGQQQTATGEEVPTSNAPSEPALGQSGSYPRLVGPAEAGTTAPQPAVDRYGTPIANHYESSPVENSIEPNRLPIDPTAPGERIQSLGRPLQAASRYETSNPAATPPLDEGTGKPGNKQLEGPQTPQLTIQKFAPAEIQVGRPSRFRVSVVNSGQIAAHGVKVFDEVPRGTRLVDTTPKASFGANGELFWQLGTIQPGEEVSVEVQLMPTEEGEIGSVATVSFNADASARTTATKPELAIRTSVPGEVLIGEDVTLAITVSNPGSGVATGVTLVEHIPPGLHHPEGDELRYEIGDLKPGESRQLELTLDAKRPGLMKNRLIASGDANLVIEDEIDVVVVAPQLRVGLTGPKRRYLERAATYTLSVFNEGTAPAKNVELAAHLPPGLEYVDAPNAARYEEATRTVYWHLEELEIQDGGSVELITMPVEAGQQILRFSGSEKTGTAVEGQQPVVIEGMADVSFQIVDTDDPIEKGGQTLYEIRVLNQGSKAATNVQITVTVPPEMRATAAEGPARHVSQGNQIIFEALPRLAAKADTTYRIRVQGLQPGDLRLRVQLLTDEIRTPIVKEEGTKVYSDE